VIQHEALDEHEGDIVPLVILTHTAPTGRFRAAALDDPGTLRAMGELHRSAGELIDPHSAIGIHAAEACRTDRATPIVALGTAHPAKFPDAVEKATGIRPQLPEFLADLHQRPERIAGLPNALKAVQDYVLSHRRNDRNG